MVTLVPYLINMLNDPKVRHALILYSAYFLKGIILRYSPLFDLLLVGHWVVTQVGAHSQNQGSKMSTSYPRWKVYVSITY